MLNAELSHIEQALFIATALVTSLADATSAAVSRALVSRKENARREVVLASGSAFSRISKPIQTRSVMAVRLAGRKTHSSQM